MRKATSIKAIAVAVILAAGLNGVAGAAMAFQYVEPGIYYQWSGNPQHPGSYVIGAIIVNCDGSPGGSWGGVSPEDHVTFQPYNCD